LKDPITALVKFERSSNDRFKWKIKNIENNDEYNYEITIKFGNQGIALRADNLNDGKEELARRVVKRIIANPILWTKYNE